MPFDAHKNLAITAITVAPEPATTGNQLSVTTGEGVRFPTPPFNATVWPKELPSPANAEIIRVTAIGPADVFTFVRGQENSSARSIVVGDLIVASITAKSLTDIESGVNFPLITTPGSVTAGADVVLTGLLRFTGGGDICTFTPDGADNQFLSLRPYGGTGGALRGGTIVLFGNEYASAEAGTIRVVAGQVPTGNIDFYVGGSAVKNRMHASGGFSIGNTTDPGANNLGVVGNVVAANLKWRQGHTWALIGDVTTLTAMPSMRVQMIGTQTVKLAAITTQIASGTSVGVQLLRNGIAVGGVITVTPTFAEAALGNIALAHNDALRLQLSAPVGVPSGLSVTVQLDHSV